MKRNWTLLLAILALLVTGCQERTMEPDPTATLAPTATATPEPTATATATPLPPTATPFPTVTPPANPLDRFEQGKRLGRGINLGNALEAPNEGEWGMVLEKEFFGLIAEAGFDTIRVPIRWSAHAMEAPPYTIDETFFERVDWVIENGMSNGLNVVLNMHHYEEIFTSPTEHTDRFIAMWQQIVRRYRDQPDNLYFEPLNEPHDRLTENKWNTVLAQVVTEIRALDKFHTIVVTGGGWGGIDGLMTLKIPEGEENYVCTFHTYDPFPFTHQGATWPGDHYTVGVQWPGPPEVPLTPDPDSAKVAWLNKWYKDYNEQPVKYNPCGPRAIDQKLDWAVKWGEKLDCQLWMGEFGAYDQADMDSRVAWTTYMREQAEERGFSWAYWEFGAGFGIYDRNAGAWREGLLEALIPAE